MNYIESCQFYFYFSTQISGVHYPVAFYSPGVSNGMNKLIAKDHKSQIDIIALNDRSTTREVRFQVSGQLKAPL